MATPLSLDGRPIAGITFVAKGIGADMLLIMQVSRVQFIPPALPRLRASPPIGDGWQYEVKFDGYRTQLHKAGLSFAMYGKNGGDFTSRFPAIAAAVLDIPTRSCVIDVKLAVTVSPTFLRCSTGGMCRHASIASICLN